MISGTSLHRRKISLRWSTLSPALSFAPWFASWSARWRMRLLLGVLAAFCCGALVGCSHRQADRTDTLFVALSAAPSTLDPRFSTDATGMRVTSLIFDSIVRLGADLQIQGEAATSWTYQNLVYTFQLRPDMGFADGSPVTGEDIEFSFEQYRDPKSPFSSTLKVIEKVEYNPSARELKLTLNKFSATFLTDLTPVKILPKHVILKKGDDFGREPIGSGPFAFVSQSANEILLKARTDHVRLTPRIANLALKIIRDDSTRFYKTLKGEVDIAQAEISPDKVPAFENNPKYQIYKGPGLAMTHLLVNMRDPMLKNKEVREAIAMALHREEIIRYKMQGLGIPATSILPPASPFFNRDLKNLPFDLVKAKLAIEKAGLRGHDLTLKTSNTQSVVENARVIAHQLEAIGFKVNLQSFEWGTFYDDVRKGNFQLASMRWVGATDPDIYRLAFHSGEMPPGRNRGGYINKKLDPLLEQGLKTENLDKRIKTYLEVQRVIQEDLPIIPLWYDTQVAIVSSRIKGYVLPLNGDFSSFWLVTKEAKQ